MHTLFVIAVPIGNLKEITILGKETLESVPVIICEDTRVTQKLLKLLNITDNKKLLAIHKFNESSKIDEIYELLKKTNCALVSDAGYPVISDPGYFLIKKLREKNVKIQVINGPCAFVHAVVTSGLDSRKLYITNFLSKKEIKRTNEFKELLSIHEKSTIVFYEPNNFVLRGLAIMQKVFGDIKIGIAKELTKLNENFFYDHISSLIKTLSNNTKGEYVILIPRKNKIDNTEIDFQDKLEKINQLIINENYSLKDAVKEFKNNTHSSSLLYSEYIKKFKQ